MDPNELRLYLQMGSMHDRDVIFSADKTGQFSEYLPKRKRLKYENNTQLG